MGFSKYLEEKGFKYHESTDSYRRSKGFGRFITVEKVLLTLFTVKNENTIIHDDFIDNFNQFKEIITKALKDE